MHELSPSPTANQLLFPPSFSELVSEYVLVIPAYSGQIGSPI